jgi:hypothetical protein
MFSWEKRISLLLDFLSSDFTSKGHSSDYHRQRKLIKMRTTLLLVSSLEAQPEC